MPATKPSIGDARHGACCTASTRTAAAGGAAEADGGGRGQRGVGHCSPQFARPAAASCAIREACGASSAASARRNSWQRGSRATAPRRSPRLRCCAAAASAPARNSPAMDAAFAPPPDDKFCFDVSAFSASNFAPAAFVGKLRADGVDLTKLRADLTQAPRGAHQVVPGVAARRAAAAREADGRARRHPTPSCAGCATASPRTRRRRPSTPPSRRRGSPPPTRSAPSTRRSRRARRSCACCGASPTRCARSSGCWAPSPTRSTSRPTRPSPRRRVVGAARRRRASSATPSGCCVRGASSAASRKLRASGALVPVAAAAARADACRATLVEKSLSCLAAALHLGAKARADIHRAGARRPPRPRRCRLRRRGPAVGAK